MPRRFRFVALVALLVLSAAGLAACGGGGSSANAGDLLKATFGPDHSVKSGRLAVALGFDSQGLKTLKGPVMLKVSGPFQTEGKGKLPQLDLNLALASSGTSFQAGAVSTGDKAFLRLQGTTFAVDDATFQKFKQGYEQAASKSKTGSPTLKSLGIDPLRWLKDPRVVGTESMGGADTYHITAGVDVSKFLQDISSVLGKTGALGQSTNLPTSLTAQQRQEIASSVKSAALDVWTGKDDKALRRLRLVVDIAVPQALRAKAGGLSTGGLTFDLSISDLNQPQTIKAPTKAQPLSALRQLLGGSAAGSAGGSGASAPTATTPAPTTTTPSSSSSGGSTKYLTCLRKAGNDVAKIQQCASLAGQ